MEGDNVEEDFAALVLDHVQLELLPGARLLEVCDGSLASLQGVDPSVVLLVTLLDEGVPEGPR